MIPQQPSLREQRSFVFYWCSRTSTNGAYMMQAVAAGWQIYALTGSAFDLGLVGLVQFFPVVVLGLLVGHVADRYDRRRVAAACQIAKALAAAAFAYGSYRGWLTRDAILALLFVSGTARAFEAPTMHAMVPGIVPRQILPRAIAARVSREIAAYGKSGAGRSELAALAVEPVGSTPEQFAEIIRNDIDRWGKVARAIGLKPQ